MNGQEASKLILDLIKDESNRDSNEDLNNHEDIEFQIDSDLF